MSSWYYEKEDFRRTPSIQDGIDYEMERRYRREGAKLIIDAGVKMNMSYTAMATGIVYFHRFYMLKSFRTFPRYVTACSCLLLAGKVEETPKKCGDIIKTAQGLLSKENFETFGKNPKERLVTFEEVIMHTLKYDLRVKHPYKYLSKYAKCLKGDKEGLEKLVNTAWTLVNDSLCTTVSIRWQPKFIAIAVIYLAGKINKFDIKDWSDRTPEQEYWWDQFVEGITIPFLEEICHQVLDFYSEATEAAPANSPASQLHKPTVSPTIRHPQTYL